MRMNALLQKAVISKVGSRKMVTLPVSTWKKIKEKIEDLEEDYLMATSENYKKSIPKLESPGILFRRKRSTVYSAWPNSLRTLRGTTP